MEFGTAWVGECCALMDTGAAFQVRVLGRKFEMTPSEYARRNVRFGPFFHEPIKQMIDRYRMKEIFNYNTDYPHLEGSKDPIRKFRQRLEGLPEDYAQDFFVKTPSGSCLTRRHIPLIPASVGMSGFTP